MRDERSIHLLALLLWSGLLSLVRIFGVGYHRAICVAISFFAFNKKRADHMLQDYLFLAVRKCLFHLDPETAHRVAIGMLKKWGCVNAFKSSVSSQPISCFGLNFPNRIGLAAGFDKNAECVSGLLGLGFGFVEVGTVTPRPQSGNPKPRLFRLEEDEAIINRLGFNNDGVLKMKERLKQLRSPGIIGVNIGKNRDTSNDDAISDYVYSMNELWPYASYFAINVSSPNTSGLRELQKKKYLSDFLKKIKNTQQEIAHVHQRLIPLLLKIAPDLSQEEIEDVAQALQEAQFDGVIVGNTTLGRSSLISPFQVETGGLSGKPLCALNTRIIQMMRANLPESFSIIGVGGIMDAKSAQEKLDAGATLLQIYTGFIYRGTSLLKELLNI